MQKQCELEKYSNGQTLCSGRLATHRVERFPTAQTEKPEAERSVESFNLCEEHASDALKHRHIHEHNPVDPATGEDVPSAYTVTVAKLPGVA